MEQFPDCNLQTGGVHGDKLAIAELQRATAEANFHHMRHALAMK